MARRWAAAFPTAEGDGGGLLRPPGGKAPELLRILLGGEVFDADASELFDAAAAAAAEADMQGAPPTPRPRERVHTMSLDGVRGVELVPSATATRVAWCSELRECANIVCEQVPPRAGHLNVAAAAADGAADDDGAPPTDLRHLMQQLPGGVVASAYCGVERALAAANERLREEWAPYETLWRDADEASAAAGASDWPGLRGRDLAEAAV